MQKNQRVTDMADEVLARQVGARVRRTGEAFEVALTAVLETEAGQQLAELRDGPHGGEKAEDWQEDLAHKRAQERKREQAEEKQRAQEAAAWEQFMQEELRELEKRKAGQLAALEWLADEDRRQAQAGLVALMSMGKVSYKHLDELCSEDMAARIAANRLRMTWLKERRDGWRARRPGGRT